MAVRIEQRTGSHEIAPEGDEPILYAGLRAGLSLPYDCATGTCGMCKARVLSGAVASLWPGAPGMAKLQSTRGDILMCQSRATGDCVLKAPAGAADAPVHRPRYLAGRIDDIARLTHDVVAFNVRLPEPAAFDAGQFAVLTVPGLTGGRAYSMVNYAALPDRFELVIKRKPGGALSDWLFESDRTGAAVNLFGPLGRATLRPAEDRDLVAIAGGSGIAGVLSIVAHAAASGHFTRFGGEVYFGVRTLADGFHLDRLARAVADAKGALRVVLALSHERPATPHHPQFPEVELAHGFVHEVADAGLAADCNGRAVFVAGPPPMVDGAIRMLIGHAVPSATIRYDKFG